MLGLLGVVYVKEGKRIIVETCTLETITEKLTLQNGFYTNFESDGGGGHRGGVSGTNLTSQLTSSCSNCSKIIDDAAKIENAHLYACMQTKDKSSTGDSAPCRFFYYWFGHKYWNDLNGNALSTILDKIYEALKTSSCTDGKKCDFKYKDLENQTIFDHMKIIFDYFNDYEGVQSLLSTHGTTCAEKWSTYWETLSSACNKVKQHCASESDHNSKQYCTDFNSTYAVHCDTAKLPQKMAELITNIQREAQAAQIAATKEKEEAVSKATTTSSLSSIFGTLGMTVAPFVLYKYKPWSSWFGNHTSGNGRSRRTNRRRSTRNEFDTLAEVSTVDFTASSEANSTIDNSTTVRPTAYIGQRTKGRTNNNAGGRGMVGYQNM
ncbi:KIR-like protein [Plasmodium coatneyi]|uniref:KIR-like protein n=1 Tax=Plasmodium coatneyi TaxID=208452 RepID=A0A1B1E473_9APIC|nr:KIR-like protein [Plasmodium coatneyi]ANQ09824.1 KIR-like protein [Plasmodium coatneyi]